MILPCIDVLRKIAHEFQERLGSAQGSKHTVPNQSKDIRVIMDSLHTHQVYQFTEGRCIDADDPIVPDCVSLGLSQLTRWDAKNPLHEYNETFRIAQNRRKMLTVSELDKWAKFAASLTINAEATQVVVGGSSEQADLEAAVVVTGRKA